MFLKCYFLVLIFSLLVLLIIVEEILKLRLLIWICLFLLVGLLDFALYMLHIEALLQGAKMFKVAIFS